MKRFALGLLLVAGVTMFSGCARWEYRVIKPEVAAQRVTKEGLSLPYDPLQYKLAQRRSRLAMRIINPTESPVRLVGERSYVVDPWEASHPVRGRLIAPRSHVDLSLPPQPMYYYSSSPWYGLSWSPFWYPSWDMRFGYDWHPWNTSYEVVSPYEWTWKSGQVRLHLGYSRDNNQFFDHDFVFDRVKVKGK